VRVASRAAQTRECGESLESPPEPILIQGVTLEPHASCSARPEQPSSKLARAKGAAL